MSAQADVNFAVARHPIYHIDGDVFGYELLYRSVGGPNVAVFPSDIEATVAVLANGIHAVSQDIDPQKRIFINFPKEILEKGYHGFLDPKRFVLEVLEHVACDAAFVELVRGIHASGYVLALDDYVGDPSFDPILPFVTFIKIDFLALRDDPARLSAVIDACLAAGKTLLAEKVETEDDIALCRGKNIPLAQGYFYSRPQMVATRILEPNKVVKLSLLAEVSQPELDVVRVRDIIGSDVSLTYKLLRYVNTAGFYRGEPIDSLDYAITRLGRQALVSWASVNLLASLASTPRERELAFGSAVRGRFLSLSDTARGYACHGPGQHICLLGLLSQLDAMLGLPMDQALAGIRIDADIRQALLGRAGPKAPCLSLSRKCEGIVAGEMDKTAGGFGLTPAQAKVSYFGALAWASDMFRASRAH